MNHFFASPIVSLRRKGIHCGTVMVTIMPFGFTASFATNFGHTQAEGSGDTPVAALYDLAAKPRAIDFAVEIKRQVIGRMPVN